MTDEKDNSNPPYYKDLNPEPIVVIENWNLDFHLGAVVKYISRAGWKEGASEIDDLRKARWFLDRKIGLLESADAIEKSDTSSSGAPQNESLETFIENWNNTQPPRPNWFERLIKRLPSPLD